MKQKTFRTIKEFEDRIDRYFSECAQTGAYPDEAGMILYLGLEREEYDRYLGGAEGKGWAACLKKARLRREGIIVRDLYASEKATTQDLFCASGQQRRSDRTSRGRFSRCMTIDVKIRAVKTAVSFD